ncbi:MAG: 2-amino-4-hydroxy-6-hydroxymethyldihydropteridine diphosphokinase [Planctomycetota bacterium]|jgi:2-amino-4-hydroxy-6-hydroxymethyldihydropteridine diphosphokinase
MNDSKIAYIGLGSNLGDRKTYIENALKKLSQNPQIEILRQSDIIDTRPIGKSNQPDYLNSVVEIKTSLPIENLFAFMQEIEIDFDRVRMEKWSPRTIDLDLLFYGSDIIDSSPKLQVPHPEMHLRSFVLNGICQLDPELIHPVLKLPIIQLRDRLNGKDFFLNNERPQFISIAGIIGVGKTTLAEKLTQSLNAKLLLEPYAENPFLPALYAGNKEYALASQIYFLTSRTEQLGSDELEKGKVYIADYIFEKELIYADHFLDAQQLTLYEKTNKQLSGKVTQPVLVIYLHDSIQNCLDRIHKRNRPFEQEIHTDFLQALNTSYEQLFGQWKTCPVIKLSMDQFDCTKAEDVDFLTDQIKSYIAS